MDLASVLNYSGLFLAALAAYNNLKQTRQIRQKRDSLINCQQYPLSYQINGQLPEVKQEEKIVYIQMAHNKMNITEQTYIKRLQSITAIEKRNLINDSNLFFEGQCGNAFQYSFNNQKVVVEMNECNIDKRTLIKKEKPILLHSKKTPTHYDVTYRFKKLVNLALIGSLQFNVQTKKFVLQPTFLTLLKSKEQCFSVVKSFYNDKLSSLLFHRMLLLISIGFMASFAYYRLKKAIKNRVDKIQKGKELQQVTTRAKDRLKCACGKNMNLVGECGHLSICNQCHEKDKACKICGKTINEPIIIFI